MYILLFALSAFVGGIFSALLGWAGSNPPESFIPRKFFASVLKAFIAAVGAAIAGAVIPPVGLVATILMCGTAFISGVAVDAGLKRAVNAATAKEK